MLFRIIREHQEEWAWSFLSRLVMVLEKIEATPSVVLGVPVLPGNDGLWGNPAQEE